jgi:hypothetical protein
MARRSGLIREHGAAGFGSTLVLRQPISYAGRRVCCVHCDGQLFLGVIRLHLGRQLRVALAGDRSLWIYAHLGLLELVSGWYAVHE